MSALDSDHTIKNGKTHFPNDIKDMHSSHRLNQRRLFILRNIVLCTQLSSVIIAHNLLGMELPMLAITIILSVYGLLNISTWWYFKIKSKITNDILFSQLVIDVFIFAILLYFTGGGYNPFITLLLFPLMIVAVTLPRKYAWIMALLAIFCYSVLMVFHIPLSPMNLHDSADLDLHVIGMWFSFLFGVGFIVLFVVKMENTLRQRDHILAQARERALRDDHLVALGTFAAGAAHELGTPLSSMAVIANEIEKNTNNTEIAEQATILREQIDRCKTTLTQILARAGEARAEGGNREAINHYLKNILNQWKKMRPTANIRYQLKGVQPAPVIITDKTLNQAIINLLNNAADASIDHVEVIGRWNTESLWIDVHDRGSGLASGANHVVSQPFYTTKKHGQGLGLFLTHAVINRLGGTITLTNRNEGGVCAKISLPLARMLATQIYTPNE